jgi:rare lipoprotein A
MKASRRFLSGTAGLSAILVLALFGSAGVSDSTWAFSLPKNTPSPQSGPSVSPRPVYQEIGRASWYGPGFYGRPTASGERFKPHKLTAAHRRLPLGTTAKVTNLDNGRQVKVKINDRGPYVRGRTLDLSPAAAQQLGMTGKGTAPVKLEALPPSAAHNDSTVGTGP